jgi:hypothetical protein
MRRCRLVVGARPTPCQRLAWHRNSPRRRPSPQPGSLLAVALAVALGWSVPAQAETFALGVISSPETLLISSRNLEAGWFQDSYRFSISEGSSFEFSASIRNVFGRRLTGINDFWGGLYGPSVAQPAGGLYTRTLGDTGFYWEQLRNFSRVVLGAGDYGLFIQGNVPQVPYFSAPATYSGSLNFAPVVTAVPELSSLALMLAGLVGAGWMYRRRRSDSDPQ